VVLDEGMDAEPRQRLSAEVEEIEQYRESGHDVFAYFNNDDAGHAVTNALELRDLLGQRNS
jgi:uncharacterized protein YecE (DUF72 family)